MEWGRSMSQQTIHRQIRTIPRQAYPHFHTAAELDGLADELIRAAREISETANRWREYERHQTGGVA
jgi:hypothetical protein